MNLYIFYHFSPSKVIVVTAEDEGRARSLAREYSGWEELCLVIALEKMPKHEHVLFCNSLGTPGAPGFMDLVE